MILVIGGAGYIGSHMAKRLRELNAPHLVLDNLEKGHRAAVRDSPFVQADLRTADLAGILREHKIDLVMHFAAYMMVGESVTRPDAYWHNNLTAVLRLLDAMRESKVDKIVFSSTAAVFGEPHYVPIDEEHLKNPTSPYGDTKLAVEMALSAYDRAYGIRSVCLRYFNAAGADPDGILGEDHDPESHLIPAIILSAMGKAPKLKVFGADYDTPDGTCVRDYVHVMDLAEAHLLALNHLREAGSSRKFNLGNGEGYSVRQVIDTVGEVLGMSVPYDEAPRREGDPARLIASSKRITDELGWQPQFPQLRTIVEHAWQWRRAHPDGYHD